MGVSQIVGGVEGTIGTIFSNLEADKTKRALKALGKTDPGYTQSPYAASRLGLAQNLLNGQMPGGQQEERNIQSNQATQLDNISKNATDGSQALAMGAQAQGQTNQANANLGLQSAQDYYNRLSNLTGAQQGMISEGDKAYQDSVRKWQDQVNLTMGNNAISQQQGQNLIQNGAMWAGMGGGSGGGASSMGGK